MPQELRMMVKDNPTSLVNTYVQQLQHAISNIISEQDNEEVVLVGFASYKNNEYQDSFTIDWQFLKALNATGQFQNHPDIVDNIKKILDSDTNREIMIDLFTDKDDIVFSETI